MKNLLLKYTRYNLWANTKVCNEFIAKLDPILLDKEVPSSFPSIRKTLYHIWDAETVWYQRLNQEPNIKWPPHADFKGTFSEFQKLFLLQSEQLCQWVENRSEEDLQKDFQYLDSRGKSHSNNIHDAVHHCMNHSTFHRGQLVTMLRNVGFTELSSTDYIAYCRL